MVQEQRLNNWNNASQEPRCGNNLPTCLLTDEWVRKSIYIIVPCVCLNTHKRLLFSLKKAGNLAICDDTDELGGLYAE